MATKAEKFKASAQINASIEHKKASAKKGTKSNGAGEKESDGSIAQATKGNNAPARKRPQSQTCRVDVRSTREQWRDLQSWTSSRQ